MEINAYVPDFELPDINGKVVHLARYLENHEAIAVIFMCNHCPYVKAYIDRLIALQSYFQGQKVTLVGINANDEGKYPEDSLAKMKEYAANWGLNFPYLRDRSQDVAQAFGAICTPEPFLVDQQGMLRYRGQIDDNYRDPAAVIKQDLKEAIAQVLKGESISSTMEPAIGCSVKWKS
jgi:peroxiredoxin